MYNQTVGQRKRKHKKDIMEKLSLAYTPESGPYKTVKKALDKFSTDELSALYSMILTITKKT